MNHLYSRKASCKRARCFPTRDFCLILYILPGWNYFLFPRPVSGLTLLQLNLSEKSVTVVTEVIRHTLGTIYVRTFAIFAFLRLLGRSMSLFKHFSRPPFPENIVAQYYSFVLTINISASDSITSLSHPKSVRVLTISSRTINGPEESIESLP